MCVKNCVIIRLSCVVWSKITHVHKPMCMKTLPTAKLKLFIHNAHNQPSMHPRIHSLSQVILTPTIHGMGFVVSLFAA